MIVHLVVLPSDIKYSDDVVLLLGRLEITIQTMQEWYKLLRRLTTIEDASFVNGRVCDLVIKAGERIRALRRYGLADTEILEGVPAEYKSLLIPIMEYYATRVVMPVIRNLS